MNNSTKEITMPDNKNDEFYPSPYKEQPEEWDEEGNKELTQIDFDFLDKFAYAAAIGLILIVGGIATLILL